MENRTNSPLTPEGDLKAQLRQFGKKVLTTLDRRMERLVLFRPSGTSGRAWSVVLVHLLFLAFLARLHLGGLLTVDLFIVPILVSCIVFKLKGLLVVPVAGLLYAIAGLICHDIPSRYVGFNTLGQMLEWGVLSAFLLITLDRYSAVKRLQSRFTQDLELARRLQSSLIHPEYDMGTVRIQGFVRQTHDVGGDFYYFRPFLQKYVVFCLGDVMGKGISASMLMAMVMGFMFEWGKKNPSPGFVLKTLNHQLSRLWGGGACEAPFVTMFYAVYDEESRDLTFSVAGHQGGLWIRREGEVELLSTEGIPVGLFDETEFAENSVKMSPGDRVVLFTDGVTEARNRSGEMFGVERLRDLVALHREATLTELLEVIQGEVLRHSKGRTGLPLQGDGRGSHTSDDMAVLIMETKQTIPLDDTIEPISPS